MRSVLAYHWIFSRTTEKGKEEVDYGQKSKEQQTFLTLIFFKDNVQSLENNHALEHEKYRLRKRVKTKKT